MMISIKFSFKSTRLLSQLHSFKQACSQTVTQSSTDSWWVRTQPNWDVCRWIAHPTSALHFLLARPRVGGGSSSSDCSAQYVDFPLPRKQRGGFVCGPQSQKSIERLYQKTWTPECGGSWSASYEQRLRIGEEENYFLYINSEGK